jgi:PAS domain S-box-containing protein
MSLSALTRISISLGLVAAASAALAAVPEGVVLLDFVLVYYAIALVVAVLFGRLEATVTAAAAAAGLAFAVGWLEPGMALDRWEAAARAGLAVLLGLVTLAATGEWPSWLGGGRRPERAAAEQLTALVEGAPLAIIALDADRRVTRWSRAAEQLFGTREREMAGTRPALAPPDDSVLDDLVDLALRGQSFTAVELRARRRDGAMIDVSASTAPLRDEDGAVTGALLVLANVTERRRAQQALQESEQRFRALVQTGSDIITIVDATGELRYVSPAVERVLGYREDDLLGRNILEFVHPDDQARAIDALGEVLRQPGVHAPSEYRVRHVDGSWRDIEATASNLLEEPAIRGVVLTSRDVTERKRLEAQLLRAQKLESVGRLAGGIAHDFNNLMTAIIGDAELNMGSLPDDSTLARDLQEIRDTARRASTLAHQLLAFSRREISSPRVVAINDVVLATDRMLRRLIGADIELVASTAGDAGYVNIDPVQFEQVLVNLVVNARDAMPGGGRLTIETACVMVRGGAAAPHAQLEPGDYVMIAVSDTGAGIPPEVREHVFEPFFTTKDVGSGTGLGLATCYGIVTQAGGQITLESEAGRGTTFRIFLPRTDEQPEEEVAPEGELVEARGGETVLLVEDEAAVRSIGARALRRLGYTVLEAGDGEEALRVAEGRAGGIDVVVTDIIMPRMGGRELAERLLRDRHDLRVLFTTGYEAADSARNGGGADAPDMLTKPFSPDALARKLRETLDAPAPVRDSR